MTDSNTTNIKSTQSWQKCYEGIPIQDGYVVGPVYKQLFELPPAENIETNDIDGEIERFTKAINRAQQELKLIIQKSESNEEQNQIFQAHSLMIQDPVLENQVIDFIKKNHVTAESAWLHVMREYQELWTNSGMGSSMENRSSDIVDVGIRVVRVLRNEASDTRINEQKVILVTKELTASDALNLDSRSVLGVISERGNETSHSAILIRSKGIPAVFGLKNFYDVCANNQLVAIDAVKGCVYEGCSDTFFDEINQKKVKFDRDRSISKSNKDIEPRLPSGELIELLANVSSIEQIELAMERGAGGVGLFRTEFLYSSRSKPPSESDQIEIYKKAISLVKGGKIVFRTGDFGGDKPIPYLKIPKEDNPFMGLRGIRYSLHEQELFATQLRALLTASESGPISIMFPMVSTVDEVYRIMDFVHDIRNEIELNGLSIGDIKFGVMIEVPSAAIQIDEILKLVDFVSIGTNDLTQYVMATDRNNNDLSSLVSSFQPAVLKLIKWVIEAGIKVNKPVSICGELAGDSRFTELLIAFELRQFSMESNRISEIKTKILSADSDHIGTLKSEFEMCSTALHVKNLLKIEN